jgi:hypothetical protein
MKQKEIRKQLNSAREEIFKENEDFHDAIIAEYVTKEDKAKRKIKPFYFVAFALAIVIVAVSLVFFLPQNDAPRYLSENEEVRPISLSEINSKLERIIVEMNVDEYGIEVFEYYDKLSEDELYYYLIISNDYETAIIYIYVNKDYTSRKEVSDNYKVYENEMYTMRLSETVKDENIFKIYSDTAQVDIADMQIYLTYQEMSISEESSFFKFFEKTIKTK